jgi:hypothetical protein
MSDFAEEELGIIAWLFDVLFGRTSATEEDIGDAIHQEAASVGGHFHFRAQEPIAVNQVLDLDGRHRLQAPSPRHPLMSPVHHATYFGRRWTPNAGPRTSRSLGNVRGAGAANARSLRVRRGRALLGNAWNQTMFGTSQRSWDV